MADSKDLYWRAADGLMLHARDYPAEGGRLPVICIHGLTRNSKDFEALAPRIQATGRRTIAVDVRGRGLSDRDPNPGNYNPGTYAADIIGLMASQVIQSAVFIGTSMGGIVAMVLSAIAPHAVAGAVLNDVGPELSPVGLARIAGYVGQGGPIESWADAVDYIRSINEAAFPNLSAEEWERFARRTFREDDLGRPVLDYDPDISLAFRPPPGMPPPPAPDMWPLFFGLSAGRPVLLIGGAISDLIDEEIAGRMREAAPKMAYAEVPNVGHAPMLTEPQAWSAVDAFLQQLP